MKSERSALVRGPDPPQGHRLHTTAGDIRRVLARRMIKNKLAAGMPKTDDKISRSVSNGKKKLFSQVWKKSVVRRRQTLAPKTWTT